MLLLKSKLKPKQAIEQQLALSGRHMKKMDETSGLSGSRIVCRPGRMVCAVLWQAPDTMPSASPAATCKAGGGIKVNFMHSNGFVIDNQLGHSMRHAHVPG